MLLKLSVLLPLITMPARKTKKEKNEIEIEELTFKEKPSKKKRIEKQVHDSLELANKLYEYLYINNDTVSISHVLN